MRSDVHNGFQFLVFFRHFFRVAGQSLLVRLPCSDVRANGDILDWFAGFVKKRKNRCRHPIKRSIFCAILYLSMPDLAVRNGEPQFGEESLRMMA